MIQCYQNSSLINNTCNVYNLLRLLGCRCFPECGVTIMELASPWLRAIRDVLRKPILHSTALIGHLCSAISTRRTNTYRVEQSYAWLLAIVFSAFLMSATDHVHHLQYKRVSCLSSTLMSLRDTCSSMSFLSGEVDHHQSNAIPIKTLQPTRRDVWVSME